MGKSFKDARLVVLTIRCAWCGFIKMGLAWGPDRRRPSESKYSHGICPGCKENYF